MRAVVFSLAAAAVLLAGLAPPLRAASAPALAPEFSTSERLMQWTFTYLSHPEPQRVPAAVHAMYRLGLLRDEEKTGFFIGFIAGVLARNPDQAERLVAQMLPLPPKEQAVVVKAIAYSGLNDWPVLMRKFADDMPERQKLIEAYLSGAEPTLMTVPWDAGPPVVYTLWGYYVATGYYEPVKRIISTLAWSKRDDGKDFSWRGVMAAVGFGDDGADQIALERLIVGSTAKWTLVSYAEHHRDLLALYRVEQLYRPEKVTVPLQEVLEAAEAFEAERVRKTELAAIEDAKRAIAARGSSGSRAAYAGSVGIATACVVAGATGHPEIAVPCVVTGAVYAGAMKLISNAR